MCFFVACYKFSTKISPNIHHKLAESVQRVIEYAPQQICTNHPPGW